jgi:hypothetical protein
MKKLIPAAALLVASVGPLSSCSSHGVAAGSQTLTAPRTSPAPTTSAGPTPTRNYNNPSELSSALTQQWDHELADPVHAHYRAGVSVAATACAPDTALPYLYACTTVFSRGDTTVRTYMVARDGSSFEAVQAERHKRID